jgi:predicted transporter
MIEALSGLLIVAVVAVAVLVYLEVIDLSDLVGGVIQLIASAVKLIAGLLFALGAFFVWLVNRSRQQNKP